VRVTANQISLRLTLTPKLLSKSFDDAVIGPFIKAYNKRAELAVSRQDLLGVRLDEAQVLKDLSVPAAVVLLKHEEVHAELSFRAPLDPSMELPSNPFQAPPSSMGGGAPKKEELVDFHDDDRSEIDRMKAERRAARIAREATSGAAGDEAAKETVEAAEADAPAAPSEPEPLRLLAAAEQKLAQLEEEVVAVRAVVASAAGEFAEGLLVDASKRAAALSAAANKLQYGMDEIAIGDLDESEVPAARARRKAVNAKLEGSLLPAARSLPSEVKAALAAL